MKLYYRADTRNPRTIFQKGFSPRSNYYFAEDRWWQYGVRENFLDDITSASDADIDNVVCLSKRIEATPLFPVSDQYHTDYDSDIYIYVMALPDAELPDDMNTPQNISVFDMQAYQSRQVNEILSNPSMSVNPAMAGYVLSGHEAFAHNVPKESIICAVKCKRSDFAITAGLPVFSRVRDDAAKYVIDQTRYFEIGHEVFMNQNYTEDAQHKSEAIRVLHEVHAKGLQPTANIQDALNNNGINYDKDNIYTSTYFWQELTSFHFGMVFFSILESIYYAAAQLMKYMTNTSEQKNMEIVETLPESMQAAPAKQKTMSFYGRYFSTVGVLTGEADPVVAYMMRNF